jgi:hypothetical protein
MCLCVTDVDQRRGQDRNQERKERARESEGEEGERARVRASERVRGRCEAVKGVEGVEQVRRCF